VFVDIAKVDALNALDERVTLATLPAMKAVVEGEMVATVKIIPFAIAGALLDRRARAARGALPSRAFRPKRVGVVSTLLPGLKPSVVDKTILRVLASGSRRRARASAQRDARSA
jgi:molybdenum cofactor cytidylyltransferase